ncbi:MAG TPA: cytochrome-c oxidase, cbb3-type subunit III [Xanthobacteraceae bacterium]|jgi:cytochrome c oxidase cbb3-type subunit 3
MADDKHDIDSATGTPLKGHVWDGIRELDTPLPRWWLWIFYATIAWSVGYWVVYPSWPLFTSYSKGVLGWQSRAAVVTDLAELKAQRGPLMDKLAAATLDQIAADPQMLDFARAQGRVVFRDNCAACHGAGGGGGRGYPNLNDDDWLFGGKLEQIANTIRHGSHAGDKKGHDVTMPAFGRDGMLKRAEIETVADYARSLSGLAVDPKADLAAGRKIFAENCVICHGDAGKGDRERGAPNLTDAIWLYGPEKATIIEGLWNGRGGVMPAWAGRLDETSIKAVAVYVHTLGGGEK